MSGYAQLSGDAQLSSSTEAPKSELRLWGVRQATLVQVGLLTAQLINAAYNVMAQHILTKDGADPLVFSVYRDLAAAPLLSVAAFAIEGSHVPAVADVPRIAAQGFLGVFCNQVLFLVGVQMTSATTASIVNLTLPVFAAVLAILLGMEAFNWTTAIGLALAVAGAMFIQAGGGSVPVAFNIGVGVIALGAFTSAVYIIIQKGSLARYPPVSMTSWEYWIGLGAMFLAAVLLVEHGERWVLTPNAQVALLFSVVFNSVLKYALNTFCNKHVSVITLTVYATMVPVLTALLSAVFLNTSLWDSRYLGAVPIVTGTLLVTHGRAEATRPRAKEGGLPVP